MLHINHLKPNNSKTEIKLNVAVTKHHSNDEPANKIKKLTSLQEKNRDLFASSDSDSLSELCKSSQFAREIEIAMCECNSPIESVDSNVLCQSEQLSPEILVSTTDPGSVKFSPSTTSCPDSNDQNLNKSESNSVKSGHSYVIDVPTKNIEVDINQLWSDADIPDDIDQWGNDINCTTFGPDQNAQVSNKSKNNSANSGHFNVIVNSNIDHEANKLCFIADLPDNIDQWDNDINCNTSCHEPNTQTSNKIEGNSVKKDSNNIDVPIAISNITQKANKLWSVNDLPDDVDHWGDDINCDITRLIDSTTYKKQVTDAFDFLESSIIQDEPADLGVTLNAIDWNETMARRIEYSAATAAVDDHFVSLGPFYGLPARVMNLIQQFKGIEKLYDWQHECLELEAVRLRKNLVYSLPTSGGKTLVSEILVMRELLCRRKNALLILPYVSIVQEKVWALSPFALALDFLVEEYAAGKGCLPPRRRRHKRTVYVATIEKALALIDSLTEEGRLTELGLAVVDELHLLGEEGRGATLECVLLRLLCTSEKIQIVAMSATIGNLPELCQFLKGDSFTKDFRPVELKEYVWCEGRLAECRKGGQLVQVPVPESRLFYSPQMTKLDPDKLGALVFAVVPNGSCLLFCPTKKNCENVAILLSRVLPRELLEHKKVEKISLARQMEAEGGLCDIHKRTLPFGIAYHHSGLTVDDRRFIEDSFRNGVINVICCTSTLAAGVNLPAQRVILRSPYVGIDFITLSRYKQMSGRAGRAGLSEVGQSILVCERKDLPRVRTLLSAPMDEVVSRLSDNDGRALRALALSCISLGTAPTRRQLQKVATRTLIAVQAERLHDNAKLAMDKAICDLFKKGALNLGQTTDTDESRIVVSQVENVKQLVIGNDTVLSVSLLGRAATKSGLELDQAQILHEDLRRAKLHLVLVDSLHLLYLVTPYDLAAQVRATPTTLYQVYSELDNGELQTARAIGITEACAAALAVGQFPRTVPKRVLTRFHLSVMLHALWRGTPVPDVATRFDIPRGFIQQLMTSSATFSASVVRFCDELNEFWAFSDMLRGMTSRLHHCASQDLLPLMELPSVKLARAKQLFNAGFKTLQSIARADPNELMNKIEHISHRLASQLVATAKLLLLEKVYNLREEAEDVLEGLEQTM